MEWRRGIIIFRSFKTFVVLNRKGLSMYSLNSVQNQNNIYPAFKGDLIIQKNAFKLIKDDLLRYYKTASPAILENNGLDEGPFSVIKIMNKLKKVFKRMTEKDGPHKLDGTVEINLCKNVFEKERLGITYKDIDGNAFKSTGKNNGCFHSDSLEEGVFFPTNLLQLKHQDQYNAEGPYSTAVGYLIDYVNRAIARGKVQ